jgi:hypothetical protein
MRNFRDALSQAEFGALIGKRQTVISRLESPAYGSWTLRTMLQLARRRNVAVFVRFVDFPTFLKYTDDLSDSALLPQPYDKTVEEIDQLAETAEKTAEEGALKAFFSGVPEQSPSGPSARDAARPEDGIPLPQVSFGLPSRPRPPVANDAARLVQQSQRNGEFVAAAETAA